ncbi:MAG: NAD(P)-dependent oxidoreductase [Candidatus Lokiarchaeota archaeon]|nr:NAD(P)-dependent oxidoreductase [Candidatus Lokiarchaeota archaeon]
MKILITGSSGFLGYAIRKFLDEKGYETYGTTRSRPPLDKREFVFDINKDSCATVFNDIDFDVIIHTIGLLDDNARFKTLKQTNVDGTRKIIDYAKQKNCKNFIYLSSVSVYGFRTLGQNRDEYSTKIRPHFLFSKYSRSKAQAEVVVLKSGIPFTVLRLPLMIGKGDCMVSPKLVELIKNKQVFYFGKGKKLISIMPVDNLCELISILIEKPAYNQSFHVPSYHIPLDLFLNKHSSLIQTPFQKMKPSIFISWGKLNNMAKIILAFSWRGAHFQDSLIRKLLPEYHDLISWDNAIIQALNNKNTRFNTPISVKIQPV